MRYENVYLVCLFMNHRLISEPPITNITPIQNGAPSATPSNTVLEAVENNGVAYDPIASVSMLPCNMPYPQQAYPPAIDAAQAANAT